MKITTLTLALISIANLYGQSELDEPRTPCSTSELYNQLVIDHPEVLIERQKLQSFTQKFIADQAKLKTAAVNYTIPVVFHIIHNNGSENISDAQVNDEMVILNKDFNRLNSDTTLIYSTFKPLIANVGVTFKLAQIDPNGNCTTGIERVVSALTSSADNTAKFNPWPQGKYLNIWVVKNIASGSAGYSYYPGVASGTVDGVMVLSNYVGSIGTGSASRSRCVTHEVGHFLNLQHVWGDTNSPGVACGDDGVSDTPLTKGWNTCPTSSSAQVCTPGVVENYQNYMEYSYCSNHMFTKEQALRMIAALNSTVGLRSSLWSPANLTATGLTTAPNLCAANFTATQTNICENTSVTFTNTSGGTYSWSFPGGTPSTASTATVTVNYPTAGLYDVTLTVNPGSPTTVTQSDFVNVSQNVASLNLPFVEGFEGVTVPNVTWKAVNPDNLVTWKATSGAHYTGSSCVYINNFVNDSAQVDELQSSIIDFTTMGSSKIYFRLASAQKDAASNDIFRVMTSTNCGVSWTTRQTRSGSTLKSVPPQATVFTPTLPSHWVIDSLNLSGLASFKNVIIKFQFTCGKGNNIYIDDINITSAFLTGVENEVANNIDFNIYPNPMETTSTVGFNLIDKSNVSAYVYDILGKEVFRLFDNQQLSGGEHKYSLNTSGMNSGIYFVKLMVNDELFVRKVVCNK
jgi:hypothetical protein